MLTAALKGAGRKIRTETEHRRGRRRRGDQALARLESGARIDARQRAASETPAYDLQRACGTSLSAAAQLAQPHRAGRDRCGIAGGADSASDIPLSYGRKLQKTVLSLLARKSLGRQARAPSATCARGTSSPRLPASPSRAPGCRWASTARRWRRNGRSAAREQDELALASHKNAAAAWKAGFFEDLVVPFGDLQARQQRARATPRSRSSPAAQRLRPVARPARSPPATARRSPMAPRVCCSPRKNGQRARYSRCWLT